MAELARENSQIAQRLREAADLLAGQTAANPFRVGAYRRAADTVEGLGRGLGEVLEREGLEGLVALPNVGRSIAGAIREMLATGRWALLERLRADLRPERLFQTIPTVGPGVARAICDTLKVESLEELEMAAHDGRILTVPGIGPRRAAVLRAALGQRLGQRVRPRRPEPRRLPTVAQLLSVDHEYRRRAAADRLPRIAPRRFNPERKAWLPILRVPHGPWQFTALYSNTARAHQLGRTRDWVVLYFSDRRGREGQCTVVTETHGRLAGRRVVRGREAECRSFYAHHSSHGAAA